MCYVTLEVKLQASGEAVSRAGRRQQHEHIVQQLYGRVRLKTLITEYSGGFSVVCVI